MLEVDVTLEELARMLGEELSPPNIEPRGKQLDGEPEGQVPRVRRTGPESLRHFKRTYRKALRRQIVSGTYDPNDPSSFPIREDRLYRSWPRPSSPRPTPSSST